MVGLDEHDSKLVFDVEVVEMTEVDNEDRAAELGRHEGEVLVVLVGTAAVDLALAD